MSAPIYILNKNAEREQGKKAQAANIKAAKVSVYFQNVFCEKMRVFLSKCEKWAYKDMTYPYIP